MGKGRQFVGAGLTAAVVLGSLVAGCQKPEESKQVRPVGSPGGPLSAPGRQMGGGPGMGGGQAPAADATGEQIFQQKCQFCHGPGGTGGARAPKLNALAGRADADLKTIIHDGKNRMPSFGSQLSDAQIDTVVKYIKSLGPAK